MKAEGKTRKLVACKLSTTEFLLQSKDARSYPIIIMKAAVTVDIFQYHGVRSFSVYRSIVVRRGFHLGSGMALRAGLRAGLRKGLRKGLRMGLRILKVRCECKQPRKRRDREVSVFVRRAQERTQQRL